MYTRIPISAVLLLLAGFVLRQGGGVFICAANQPADRPVRPPAVRSAELSRLRISQRHPPPMKEPPMVWLLTLEEQWQWILASISVGDRPGDVGAPGAASETLPAIVAPPPVREAMVLVDTSDVGVLVQPMELRIHPTMGHPVNQWGFGDLREIDDRGLMGLGVSRSVGRMDVGVSLQSWLLQTDPTATGTETLPDVMGAFMIWRF